MTDRLAVLRLLADGETHSGAAIAERLGLSRTAVWKTLGRLREEFGIEVSGTRGRGYRLNAPLELLDPVRIRGSLPSSARELTEEIEIHLSIESTNDRLMGLARAGVPGGWVCLAEHQRQGRGRQGRTWVAPFGGSILLSILWRFPFGPAGLAGLSLAAGTAVASALRAWGAQGLGLKWPNDVLWRRRKLAGLLIEVGGESQGPSHVVLGLGLNLHLRGRLADAIEQPWVDLATVLGIDRIERNRVAASLIAAVLDTLDRYGREGFAPFRAAWESFDQYLGQPVTVFVGGGSVDGLHMGINGDGALRVLTRSGETTFQAGEVRLRAGQGGEL